MTASANQSTSPANGPNRTDGSRIVAYQAAVGTALVAAVFSLVVCAILIHDYRSRPGANPHEATPLKTLKLALKNDPTNEALQKHIRALDLHYNQELRRQQRLAWWGAVLLLGGVIVFLASASTSVVLRRRAPMPAGYAPPPDLDAQTARVGAWAIGILAWLIVVGALVLLYRHESPLSEGKKALMTYSSPPGTPTGPKSPPSAPGPKPSGPDNGSQQPAPAVATTDPYDPPSAEEIAKWWSRFRGPDGSGHSRHSDIPTTWNVATGENIRWKTPVPLPGNNSPVVWGDRVFLSGATKDKRQVYCFDAKDGKMLWQTDITSEATRLRRELKAAINAEDYEESLEIIHQIKPPTVMEDTGYAAPSVVTDGHNVFAIFASGDIAALNFDGAIAWEQTFGTPVNAYGHSSSLAMYKNLLLVQLDQGTKKESKSKLYALNAANGETVWKVRRDVPNSWASPAVVSAAGREQLLTAADPWVIAYNPADGKELWRADCLRQDIGPSPVCQGDVVFVATEYRIASAIRANGSDDVTETHIVWQGEDGLPDTCSPLATDEFVFLLAADTLTCYDIKTGEILWEQYEMFDDAIFISSPSLVGNLIYLVGKGEEMDAEEGEEPRYVQKSFVVEPNRKGCKLIATATLDEECVTSPAFQPGCLYLRGKDHVYCIGKKLPAASK